MNEKQIVTDAFKTAFKTENTPEVYFAPGRVNLIGEHIDYNGGHVFPCALSIGTYAAVSPRNDDAVRFYSVNFPDDGIIERNINDKSKASNYSDYPIGVIYELQKAGFSIPHGFNMAIYGNIPSGAGLSSSASLEVLTAYIIKDMLSLDIDGIEIAKISQKAENEFVGVNCGIMDQFIIANAKKDCAIFLDTNTLDFDYVPLKLDGYKIVIADTKKIRGLKDSKYNERRVECERAVKEIGGIKYLCELREAPTLSNEILTRRVRHVISENNRTIDARKVLYNNDIISFGKLMIDSHISLRDDYEVTGIELDTLFEKARARLYVIGTRMTGAGFGGCTVSIVKDEYINDFIENVTENCYVVEIGGGPKKI